MSDAVEEFIKKAKQYNVLHQSAGIRRIASEFMKTR